MQLKKIKKNIIKYCSHCDERASYLLYYTNPVIIQQGSNGALCKKCMKLLINEIKKVTKDIKLEQEDIDNLIDNLEKRAFNELNKDIESGDHQWARGILFAVNSVRKGKLSSL